MSTLLKEDFTVVNTSAWDNFFKSKPMTDPASENEATNASESSATSSAEGYPAAGQLTAWGTWLQNKLKENAEASKEARQPEKEILDHFFSNFFETNWQGTAGAKLKTFKALRRLFVNDKGEVVIDAFDRSKNALLEFLLGDFAKNLISGSKITEEKLNVLLYAFVKSSKKVAAAEFRSDNDYNLIYCPLFYDLDETSMSAYLTIQAKVLNPAKSSYEDSKKSLNKKVFLYTKEVTEQDTKTRANIIKNNTDGYTDITSMKTANKLNSLELAKAIIGYTDPAAEIKSKSKVKNKGKLSQDEQNSIATTWASLLKGTDTDTINTLISNKTARAELMDTLLIKLAALQSTGN